MTQAACPHPYADYLRELAARTLRDIEAAPAASSPHAGADDRLTRAVTAGVEDRRQALLALSHDVHAHPELRFAEHYAVQRVAELLTANGHDAEVGAWGLPTALHASAGTGGPRIAILAEYDALPGIGHACGHNIICATGVGAFLAVADQVEALGGTVELFGTPAEEGGGGKELIIRAGGFDHVDAAIMLHPFGVDAAAHPWLGVRTLNAVFHGRTAHAAATPHLGVNALDALVTAYNGFSQLRQHVLPGDRVHGIITDGGQQPNIVPDRAAGTFYLRSRDVTGLVALTSRATQILEGAARVSGAAVEIEWDPTPLYMPLRNNLALASRYAVRLAPRGRKVLPEGVLPAEQTGSTDMGNVSLRVPSIHPLLAVAPLDVAIHHPAFAEWAANERGDAGVIDGAVGLALTAADYLADPDLRAAAAAEFTAAGGVIEAAEL